MVGARNTLPILVVTQLPLKGSLLRFWGGGGAHGEGRTNYQASIVGVEGKERLTPSCLPSTLS